MHDEVKRPVGRPRRLRRVACRPAVTYFKPAGIPRRDLPVIELTRDELEAVRLSDRDGLYQEQVAIAMGVSRPTVGRILNTARQKIASALIDGCALSVAGGAFIDIDETDHFCARCRHHWRQPDQSGPCPHCGIEQLFPADSQKNN
ncbi:MAG: DUF134 domain-containing protein [Candidatus Neomarinimicrobiota bacterium]